MLTKHGMQPGDPGHTFGQPGLGQPASRPVLDLDIVMLQRPVITHEQHNSPPVSQL